LSPVIPGRAEREPGIHIRERRGYGFPDSPLRGDPE